MANLLRSRKKRLVLDIGASAIRLCELAQTKSGYQLTKYYQREFNADPSLDEEVRKNLKRKALAQLLKEAKVRTRKVIFGVPGQSVFTRSRTLPPVPEYKVNQIVRYEIQQQIPFSLDQIAMDYQVLDRTEAGGYDVMMAAIKVDVVEKHMDILLEAKCSIDVVDVSPIAAYNWLKTTGEFGDQGDCVALIDMGAATTDIVIERENQFRFTRPLNIGGNDITQALASALGVNFSDAEKLKRERGFAPTGDPKRDGKGGEVIGNVLQRMVSEILRSFSYFRSLPGGGQVNRVILCGGGACLRNIIPYMQRQLGVEVRIAQPLAGLAISPAAQQVSERPEQACVVLGLALRTCEPPPIELNLIPPRVLEMARRKQQAVYWAISLAALAVVMASIIPVSANDNKAVQARIEQLKTVIRAYDPEMAQRIRPEMTSPPNSAYRARFMEAQGVIRALQRDVEILDRARESRMFWLDEIDLINELRPTTGPQMWFSSIETVRVGQEDAGQAPGQRFGGMPQQPMSVPQFQDEERPRLGASFGRGSLAPQAGIGRGGIGAFGVPISGFPGVDPRGGIGGAAPGGAGFRGFGPAGGDAGGFGGRAAARRGGVDPQQAPPIAKPNALKVFGFSESDVVIKDFVAALRKAERTFPNGQVLKVTQVLFSEASVQRYPWETLYDAPLDDMGPRTARDTGGVYNPAYDRSVYSFTIVVQFADRTRPPAPAAPPGSLPIQ